MTTNGTPNSQPSQALQAYAARLGAIALQIQTTHAASPLPLLVGAVLNELTSDKASFTAFDVTMMLRALFPYPQRELPHYDRHGIAGVQPEVHRQMAAYLVCGAYTTRATYPNGVDLARLYTPPALRRRRSTTITIVSAPNGSLNGAQLPVRAWVVGGGVSKGDGGTSS